MRLIHWFFLAWVCLGVGFVQAAPVQISLGDLKLNANWERATEQPGKRLYVLVHGTLAHNKMEIISDLQQRLKQAGQDSLAINLSLGVDNRDSQMFDCAGPHLHRHRDAVDEIAAWLNWAKQQGVQEVTLVGHSRGGNQAAWAATELKSPLIKKLVLLAPMTWSVEAERADYQKRYGKDLNALLQQAVNPVLLGPVDFLYCPGTQVQAASILDYYGADARKDTPYLLQKITLPTLVFVASADEVVVDLPMKLHTLSNPLVKVQVIEGADHFFRDLYLDEVA